MIKVRNLNKTFEKPNKVKILHNVSLNAYPGEVYGFLGHNGAGKTTTMQIICNLSPYDSGEIEMGSKNFGFVPESPMFYDTLSLMEYLKLISHSTQPHYSTKNLEELCDWVKLTPFKNRRITHFSRGMKQRAAIAASLINNPDILLMDEPTSALDPEGRADVMAIIKMLKDQGKTILLSTHILSDVENLCDRVGILKNGRMLYEGSVNELHLQHPQSIINIQWLQKEQKIYSPTSELVEALKKIGSIELGAQGLSLHSTEVEEGMQETLKTLSQYHAQCSSVSIKKLKLDDIYMLFESEASHELD